MCVVPRSFYSKKLQTLVQFFERIRVMSRDKLREPVHFTSNLSLFIRSRYLLLKDEGNSDLVHIPQLWRTLKKTAFGKDG